MSFGKVNLAAVLKRDRLLVLFGLASLTLLAWLYIGRLAGSMGNMEIAMPYMQHWNVFDLALLLLMWVVMMVAMMIPSAAPMISMFVTIQRRRHRQLGPFVPTALFLMGYLVVWSGFSFLATIAQWGLHSASLLSSDMTSSSSLLGGTLLLTAGVFQWTSWKDTYLTQCRSVLGFLTSEWREGSWGAFVMGLRHGGYCLGCCWLLMALLFVVGVMNLLWIAAIAGFVLLERVVPAGIWVSRITGLGLMGWGLWIATNGFFG